MNATKILITEVVTGYVAAMLWANADCVEETCLASATGDECDHRLDAHNRWGLADLSDADRDAVYAEITAAVESAGEDFHEYLRKREHNASDGSAAEHFGHDFALTRNGHGGGFWDRGLGELGDRLTALARPYGEAHVYVTDSGITLD